MILTGLKTGDGSNDIVQYKLFNKQDAIDEIQKIGFYALFYNVQKELEVIFREKLRHTKEMIYC